MQFGQHSFNWFDLALVLLAGWGMFRGRKHGMSEELLPLLQWLSIITVGGYTHESLGRTLAVAAGLSLTLCKLIVYAVEFVILKSVFTALKRMLGDKLLTADAFGKGEYPYGMVAGVLRYACMLIMGLAFLNSYYISDAQQAANAKMQQDSFGSISFPTIGSLQQDIFRKSFTGPLLNRHLSMLLIKPSASSSPPRETIGKKRERLSNDAGSPK